MVRVQGEEWKRLPTQVEFETVDSILRMKFSLNLSNSKRTEVALIYPWTVKENEVFLDKIL